MLAGVVISLLLIRQNVVGLVDAQVLCLVPRFVVRRDVGRLVFESVVEISTEAWLTRSGFWMSCHSHRGRWVMRRDKKS